MRLFFGQLHVTWSWDSPASPPPAKALADTQLDSAQYFDMGVSSSLKAARAAWPPQLRLSIPRHRNKFQSTKGD